MVQSANGLTDGLAKHEWKEELFLRWLLLCRFLFFCVCAEYNAHLWVGGWVGGWGPGVGEWWWWEWWEGEGVFIFVLIF